jgi:Kef-type K+ transport system membrane component KefB
MSFADFFSILIKRFGKNMAGTQIVKRIGTYLVSIGLFGGLIWFVLDKGSHLAKRHPDATSLASSAASAAAVSNDHPFGLLLLQMIAILITARIFGQIARYMKQPAVVGEIIAGICLGPSVLGGLWPGGAAWLFPVESMKILFFVSQIGLVFFMFVIGLQVDLKDIRHGARTAIMISHVSIIFPFFLAVWLSYYIYPIVAPANVGFMPFALFMGVAMSITAFPVLARILQERNLTGTALGTLIITCAAADDITAWSILAFVVAVAKASSFRSCIITIGLVVLFISAMLYLVRPWVRSRIGTYAAAGNNQAIAVLVFIIMLGSAWVTETIGIHALFGAFLAGIIMPADPALKRLLTNKVEDISMLILLPIFFAYTGMHTQIGLLGQQHLWAVFAMVMLVAVGGKLGGSAVVARLMGQSWRNAVSIGALMKTRGLMELVVVNIGYELGILSPEVFSMMVLMALITTFMTGPLLNACSLGYNKTSIFLRDV